MVRVGTTAGLVAASMVATVAGARAQQAALVFKPAVERGTVVAIDVTLDLDRGPATLALTAPIVRVFYSVKAQMPVSLQRLDLSGGTSDRILGREPPEKWNFTFLDELWAGDAAKRN